MKQAIQVGRGNDVKSVITRDRVSTASGSMIWPTRGRSRVPAWSWIHSTVMETANYRCTSLSPLPALIRQSSTSSRAELPRHRARTLRVTRAQKCCSALIATSGHCIQGTLLLCLGRVYLCGTQTNALLLQFSSLHCRKLLEWMKLASFAR